MRRLTAAALLLALAPLAGVAAERVSPEQLQAQDARLAAAARAVRQAIGKIDYGAIRSSSKPSFEIALHRLEVGDSLRGLRPDLPVVSRGRADALDLSRNPHLRVSLEDFLLVKQFVNTYHVPESLSAAVGEREAIRILDPLESAQDTLELIPSLQRSNERMRRYAIKYGPRSAVLNWLEVGMYLLFLQRMPGFGPTVHGGPGPLEPIAAYTTVNGTFADQDIMAISTLELGIRHYNFWGGWGEGQGVLGSRLKPAYFSFGAVVAAETDGVLTNPFRGEERWGGFLGWGDLKVVYLGGSEGRLMLSKQLQFIRNVF